MIIHFLVFFTLVPPSNRATLSVCVSLTVAGHGTRRKWWPLQLDDVEKRSTYL
uniref:Uncharacterized protein n=1 Tax=Setaria viridis TaxID=4556 RepID=A0A4U6U5S1_SETVI|nr:hypothetical protein SEVIR_6G109201v2 [Setaria viridis]